MPLFSVKKTFFHGYLLSVAVTFLAAFIFSMMFTYIPLRTQILPVFANLGLGLAVFSGAFYVARKTPFFRIANSIRLSLPILCTVIVCTLLWGELEISFLTQKAVLICAATLLGEVCGRL